MITKIRGVIISETAYGDTSKIINIITEDHGTVGIIAKGAKGMKSKLRAVTSLFTYGDFHLYYKPEKLSTLIAVDVVDPFNNLKIDILQLGYLTYLSDLTKQVMNQNTSSEVFKLYINTLIKINDGLSPEVMSNILEIKLLDFLGISLNLDNCIKCGDTKNIMTIDGDLGGYVCAACQTDQKIVSPKALKMLRMYYYVEIDSISKIEINPEVAREINYFLDKYYERYTGIYLNSKNFLESVKH